MKAVLLLAFGGPEDLDSVEPFIRNVLPGRPITPELLERVRKRYQLIGGKSPLPEITRKEAALLEERLGPGYKVYVGMRHWHPFISDTVKRIWDDGYRSVVALPMAAQNSRASTGGYIDALNKALVDFPSIDVKVIGAWHKNPQYIKAIAGKVTAALDSFPAGERDGVYILFSAHSLPRRTVEGDPYEAQLAETVSEVMKIIGPADHSLAYQSKGQAPGEWLGPDAEEVMARLASEGRKSVLIVPVGFVCDHVETLYDIDIMMKKKADEHRLTFRRAESLNVTPTFIDALAEIVSAA